MSFGGGVLDMMFYFLCQKPESVGMSEIVLESLRNSDQWLFFTQKHVKERHQEIKAQLKDCRYRLKTKLMEVLGLYPDMCDLGPQE